MSIMRLKQTLFHLTFVLAFGWAGHAPAQPGMAGSNAPHHSRHESKRLRGDTPERLRGDERERLRGDLEQFSQQQPERAEIDKRRQYFRERAKERFRHADTNGNGLLNRDELSRLNPNAARNFDEIDQDRDGELSEQEVAQILRKRMQLRSRQPYLNQAPNP